VILFKAQRTIAQSQENKKLFHELIDGLSASEIKAIREKTNVPILRSAFQFFKTQSVTDALLVRKLKDGFSKGYYYQLEMNEIDSIKGILRKYGYTIIVIDWEGLMQTWLMEKL